MKTKTLLPLLLLIMTLSFACKKIDQEHEEAMNVEIKTIDFSKLKQGEYTGYYAGGMFGWRENECRAFIDSINTDSSRVISVELIRSVEDRPQSFFDTLYNRVITRQSLQVSAISGATLTSKAHLKALEDALIKSEQAYSENE